MASALLERETELQAVDALLDAAHAAAGRLLLVEGHAGIGKTALLDEAVARARASAMTVMRARGAELESAFAFGVALQLFEPLLAGADDEVRDRLLAGSAALAGPLLERPTTWRGNEADERAYPIMHGLFWVLSNLADGGPVLLVVDDAHWADRASLRLVLYLLQRLDEMAVAILVARRLGEPGAPGDLLGQVAAHARSRRVRPAALSRDAARVLVGARLRHAEEPFADACWRMTEGNAFLLGELVGAVAAEGFEPTARNAPRLGSLAPEPVLRAVAVRLMRLSDDAAGVARAVAVLGGDAQLRHVAALTGRRPEHVAAAGDALAAGEILRPPERGVLQFAHPLLASAVYADVGPGERAALHRRAAEILHGEAIAPERVAAHLLPSPGTGEEWVVEVLEAAARRALETGVPESAAGYLRRALDEPPPAALRAQILRELGLAEAASGLPTAVGCLEESLHVARDDGERARTLLALARTLAATGRQPEARAVFADAAAMAGAPEDVAAHARAEAHVLALLEPDGRAALLGDRRPPPDALVSTRSGLAALSLQEALRGTPREEVLGLAERALAADADGAEDAGGGALFALAAALLAADELARHEEIMTAALARARAQGSMMTLATASLCRAAGRWARGRLADAVIDAEQAVAAERYGWQQFLPSAYGVLVGVLLDRGEVDAARDAAARHAAGTGTGSAVLAPWHESLGWLALAERRDGDALAHFEDWRDVAEGVRNPACGAAWRSACAQALMRLGRSADAHALARAEVQLAREFGAPRALSIALRAQARTAAHGGGLGEPVALLEEAVAVVGASQARLEHCRALLALGTMLRRAGRRSDAGRALGEALERARACGARLIEERTLEELEVAGARVRRAALRGVDALSPSERRVVGLAIEGLSNRQIAEALFVTRKAVEWHLGNAYRKLDVRSRHELAAALGVSGDAPT